MDLIVSPRIVDQPMPAVPALISYCAWCEQKVWLGIKILGDLPAAVVVCRPCAEGLNPDDTQWVHPDERERFLAVRDSDA